MYSATAAHVARLRVQYAELDDDTPAGLLALVEDRLEGAEQRLIAERDPVQREALRQADADRAAELEELLSAPSVGERLRSSGVGDVVKRMSAAWGVIAEMTSTSRAVAEMAREQDKAEAERQARAMSFLNIVMSALQVASKRLDATTNYLLVRVKTTTGIEPLLDLHTHSLVAAPRPGPLTNVRASVSHLVAA